MGGNDDRVSADDEEEVGGRAPAFVDEPPAVVALEVGHLVVDVVLAEFDHNVTTIGRAKFVHVHVKGFMLSGIQAKIVKEEEQFLIVNLGRKGKTKVNGEPVNRLALKNGDIIQVGKSVFRFVEGR